MAETKLKSQAIAENVIPRNNLLSNGNFINNSTNGYGGTPDDWTNSSGNPVQGGFPTMTKQALIDLLGIADGDIEGLWNLNEASGNAIDLSSNGYNLTDNNTVGNSADGLMAGGARDFEASNNENFSIATSSATNLNQTGNSTYFLWFKPESLGTQCLNYIENNASTAGHGLRLESNNTLRMQGNGLTTNATVDADVKMETNKWYFICGVYDATNTKLKIWVNGVKKEVTASGSMTSITDGSFSIGSVKNSSQYADGLIQNAGVLSKALTDAQVKRLWSYTSYKGIKVRRSGSDGYVYQDLRPEEVERLRGKTLTLRATAYKDTSATDAIISIFDGTDTESADLSTNNAWEDLSVTKTISATATQIQIRLKAKTSNGNVWYKEVALTEGIIASIYTHSSDDWSRFPRLLKMDIPQMIGGKPYQYEENKLYTFDTFDVTSDTMTMGSVSGKSGKWSYLGRYCSFVSQCIQAKTGTGTTYGLYVSVPIQYNNTATNFPMGEASVDNMHGNTGVFSEGGYVGNKIQIRSSSNMTADGVGRGLTTQSIYEIA